MGVWIYLQSKLPNHWLCLYSVYPKHDQWKFQGSNSFCRKQTPDFWVKTSVLKLGFQKAVGFLTSFTFQCLFQLYQHDFNMQNEVGCNACMFEENTSIWMKLGKRQTVCHFQFFRLQMEPNHAISCVSLLAMFHLWDKTIVLIHWPLPSGCKYPVFLQQTW